MHDNRTLYRLLADPLAITRWHLCAPLDQSGAELDPRQFTEGKYFQGDMRLHVPLSQVGDSVDFNFAAFDMVVTPSSLNAEVEKLVGSAIQRIPAVVEGATSSFEILNVVDTVRCIDEINSLYTKWTPKDGRPDKVGQYRMILKMRLNSLATDGHHLFRVEEWPISLIASEEVKTIIENAGTTGLHFQPVT